MSKVKAAIIEDEYPAARLLRKMITEIRPEWEVELLPGNIEESVKWFSSHPHPDILFLDIQLTDGNSFSFIEQAHPESMIIFTTAYDEYAIRAFSVNSIDYLLKPIHRDRLEDALAKFERLSYKATSEYRDLLNIEETLKSMNSCEKRFRTRFLISLNNRLFTLQVSDVAYFFSENKITYAVTFAGKRNIIDFALNRLEEELDPDRFFRVNRQFILSVESIRKIEPFFNNKYLIQVQPAFDGEISISREKISLLKYWLNY